MKMKYYLLPMFLWFTLFLSCESEDFKLDDNSNTEELNETDDLLEKASSWSSVFRDDFNSSSDIDNQWTRTSGRTDYNSDLCHYKAWFSTLEKLDNKQCLRLKAKKINDNEYRSGHVKSHFTFEPEEDNEFRLRASIKLQATDGSTKKDFKDTYGAWPAFWTVQETNWPTQGEIDIMEGYSKGPQATSYASNLFYGTSTGVNLLGRSAEHEYHVSEGWHTYEMRWRKNSNGYTTVKIYLDGSLKKSYSNAIDTDLKLQNFGPHNIMLNMNIGHTPKDSNGNAVTGIFDNSQINIMSDTSMYVDWVQLEQRTL